MFISHQIANLRISYGRKNRLHLPLLVEIKSKFHSDNIVADLHLTVTIY